MNILFSCHASKKIGMGHFTRQLNIALEMRRRGHKIIFIAPSYNPAISLLDRKKLFYIKSDKVPFDVKPGLEVEIIILDINNTDDDYIKTLRKNYNKVISFDDQGSGRNHVDLLVDSNLDLPGSLNTKSLFGPKYILIDKRFSIFRNKKKLINEKINKVVISMGGTDPGGIGTIITGFLLKAEINFKIDLILGAGFDDKEVKPEDSKLIKKNSSKCKVHKGLSDISEILYDADVVICAGGITLYEACAVGTPALVISQAKHQQKQATLVQSWGAAANLGMWKESVLTKLLQTIHSLDAVKRKEMSIAGKKMVDGEGLKRVVNEIEKL